MLTVRVPPQERKYFDSGDYALSKAGKAPQNAVGTAIPNPQIIAHASTVANSSTSPPSGSSGLPASPAGGIPIASAGSAGSHGSHVPSSLGGGSPSSPAVGSAGIGSGPSAAKISTSPTTSSMGGGTGRPAHSQVSTFPIGSSNSTSNISPTGASSGGSQTAFAMPSGYDGNFSQDRPMAHNPGTLQTGFPQGSNLSTSPAKEGSSLAKNEISADDLMDE